ncbi:hypothetical protein H9Q69_014297 [Fusarium xylarioides]|nr:hypothetical protein H9Q69_014297 [Fusarium xylarioides]
MSQHVSRMENKTPVDPWLLGPENSVTSSSECAPSDYEQEQEDPEVAKSFDQHGSSAPLSSTSGSGNMGEEASFSECSETVPSEFCTSEKTPSLLKHFNAIGKSIATQTVGPIPKNLQAIRRQLQQLPKMPRSDKPEFKKPIADLSALFENLEMSNDTYNHSIRDLRLHLCLCMSVKLPGMSSGFGLLDEVDDEHPLPDSTSGSSTSTRVLKLLEDRYQTSYKELDLMVTQSLQILKSWLRENNVTNPQELSTLIGKAQALQGEQHQNVLHMIRIVCHQQQLKWAEESSNYHKRKLEEAVKQGYEFALPPESENSETGDAYILVQPWT